MNDEVTAGGVVETERKPPPQKDEIEVEVLNQLIAGQQPFLAWGVSRLKVSRDGKIKYMDVPIKSVGMAEVMEEVSMKSPIPPRRMIRQGTKEGRDLKVQGDVWVDDVTNKDYQDELKRFEFWSTYYLVLRGLAIDILDERGELLVKANDPKTPTQVIFQDKAIIVLKQSGLTGDHLQQLAKDVRSLTRDAEEKNERDSEQP